ncbi:MAG: S8 family serine peptidase [Candidatus Heimdallarchaeota archaeon]|nr:S8 family serine peptidase [Candidatus Heimdallarchaeota archaeon]
MKRKLIIGISFFIISIFLVQSGSTSQSATAAIDIESIPRERIEVNSMRKFVMHFDTKSAYKNFVETNPPKLAFPNLKMVLVEDMLTEKIKLEGFSGVDGVFDVTDTTFYKIQPEPGTDLLYASQDGIKRTVASNDLLNLQPLWDLGYKGNSIVVYDIDTGIRTDHVDFAGRIMPESKSFISPTYGFDRTDLSIEDSNGHGTHTAGIIAGDGTGNPDHIGVAPKASLLIARFDSPAPTEAFLAAYDYGITVGVDVINVSWGGGDKEGWDIWEIASREMMLQGMVFVTSAGNAGEDGHYTVGTPASDPNTISVASTTEGGLKSTFSSIGPSADGFPTPSIAAPGDNIVSCGIDSSIDYVTKSGTSMAAPHIAGISAILIQALKDLTIQYDPGLIKVAMMKSADPGKYSYLQYGAGIPDATQALQLIENAPTNGTGFPIMIWSIPEFPIFAYQTLPQGFHGELFVQSVSSTPDGDLTPIVTGNISSIINFNTTSWTDYWSKNYFVEIEVADDAVLGNYEGQIIFETSGGISASTQIEIEVIEGRGKVLLSSLFSNRGSDNLIGQYAEATEDLLKSGIAVNEYRSWNITGVPNVITAELLQEYDTVWMPDPARYDYFDNLTGYTDMPLHSDYLTEFQLIQDFVEAGGDLYLSAQGNNEVTYTGWGTIVEGNNLTIINNFLTPFGISISEDLYYFDPYDSPDIATTAAFHRVTEGVSQVNHRGTTLSVSGSAQILVESLGEGTLAVYESENKGRVVVSTTNVIMDLTGYTESYAGLTQNSLLTKNIFNWLTVKQKVAGNHTEDDGGVSFNIYSVDSEANLIATVKRTVAGVSESETVLLAEISSGYYTYRMDYTIEAIYNFKVSSDDDYYAIQFAFDNSAPILLTGTWENYTKPEVARLDFTVTELISKIVSLNVKLNGKNIDSQIVSDTERTFVIFTSSLEDGDNILHVVATDLGGNVLDTIYVIPTKDPGGSPASSLAVLLGILSLASIGAYISRKKK